MHRRLRLNQLYFSIFVSLLMVTCLLFLVCIPNREYRARVKRSLEKGVALEEQVPPSKKEVLLERFLLSIQLVETGTSSVGKVEIHGKHGELGPLQITRDYWQDAIEHDPGIGGEYEDCVDVEYSRKVFVAYMHRYAPESWCSLDFERLARIHNGGPHGDKKPQTVPYWNRVRLLLGNVE